LHEGTQAFFNVVFTVVLSLKVLLEASLVVFFFAAKTLSDLVNFN
jgi:hypothetical protein